MPRVVCRRATMVLLLAGVLCLVPMAAVAQQRPAPVIETAVGAYLFPDDGEMITEGALGGAGRFYLTDRLSVGPEMAFVWGEHHTHWILTGNLTYDFLRPIGGEARAFTPFFVVGGGVYATREDFFDRGYQTHYEGAFTVGGGVRARVNRRVTVGGEARIGWETHLRLNAFVGVRL